MFYDIFISSCGTVIGVGVVLIVIEFASRNSDKIPRWLGGTK
jgi:glycopeptide antibiotics resistance protein